MEDILKKQSGRLVHELLAHSYLIYLAAVVVGFGLDQIWPISFSFPLEVPLGMGLIVIGTFLAVWAQMASGRGARVRNEVGANIAHHHFKFGPYMFTRSPTQYGLSFMTIGLAMLYSSFWMLVLSVGAFIVGKFVFIRKEEHHLAKRYGAAYLEYKQHVKF